jgi:DNA-directed RNA polymerase specialized sigma subunit
MGEKILKPKVKPKREKSTTTVGHYVRNADLLPAVIEAKEQGEVTNKLIKMIQLIANNYSKKWRFANYSYREDMVSTAVENLCKNALKFDTVKYNNPFSYYTSAIHNSFLQYMSEEKKHRIIRDKLMLDAGANPSFGYKENSDDSDTSSFDSDNFNPSSPLSTIDDIDNVALAGNADSEIDESSDDKNETTRYDKIGHKEKAPGRVTVFKASDVYFDTVRGIYVKKVTEE